MLLQNFSSWFDGLLTKDLKTLKDLFGIDRYVFFDPDQKDNLIVLLGTDEATQTYFEMYNLQSPIPYAENIPDTFQTIWSIGAKEISIGSTCEWTAGRFPQDYTISELGLVLWHKKFESFEYYGAGVTHITGYEVYSDAPLDTNCRAEVVSEQAYRGSKSYLLLSINNGCIIFKIPSLIKQEAISFSTKCYVYSATDNFGVSFDLFSKNGSRFAVHYRRTGYGDVPDLVFQHTSSNYVVIDFNFPTDGRWTGTFSLSEVCANAPFPYADLDHFDVLFWVNSVTQYMCYQYLDAIQYRLPFLIGRLSVADGTLNPFTIDKTKSLKLTYEIRAE